VYLLPAANFTNESPGVSMRLPFFCRGKVRSVVCLLTASLALLFLIYQFHSQNINSVSLLNDRAGAITGAAAVNAPGFVVPGGLTGAGQIVALADSGLDTGDINDLHPDLQSTPGQMPKVVMLKSWAGRAIPDDPDGHGTHMAASIAGTGAASGGKFRGVAPGASIYFQGLLDPEGRVSPPDKLYDLFWPAYSVGARIHVDGWGGGLNTYGETSAQVDDFVRHHPDFFVIFGAGNSGAAPSTITTEANSKNALTVGASELPRPAFVFGTGDAAAVAEFSSRGPAGDGRIKPELLAPASAVISACSSLTDSNLPGYPAYTRMQGTSMAAAIAGGNAALLREYFKKEQGLAVISAALIKATLVNGARVLPVGPSREGFGIIDMAATIISLRENCFQLTDEWVGVAQGENLSYTYEVVDTTAPFKATLAWTDPAAPYTGSTQALVNNLDLVVRTPDGMTYYGNHFLGANSPDRANNVEHVYLPHPVPGVYTISVQGTAVNHNTVSGSSVPLQDFALVCGQAPVRGVVSRVAGDRVYLEQGGVLDISGLPVVNLVDGQVVPGDEEHLFSGASIYRTPARVYLDVDLWRVKAARVLQTGDGYIFTANNPALRTGGYSLAREQAVQVNGQAGSPADLPAGIEIAATVNPFDQKLRQVKASYIEKSGVVDSLAMVGGEQRLTLVGSHSTYTIARDAVVSYEDNYLSIRREDLPFGAGAMGELAELLPGMPVQLRIAPSSGAVEYLTVKRWVALDTVSETDAAGNAIKLQDNEVHRLIPEAPVTKDRAQAALHSVSPGEHVMLTLLPDSGEVLELQAYSRVSYGKAIDFTRSNRTFYYIGDDGAYHGLYLPPDALIYRWGAATNEGAITPGSRVRVVMGPDGKEIRQLDIAETYTAARVFAGYHARDHRLTAAEGASYLATGSTAYLKNGYPVMPQDLRPGEKLNLEYNTSAITGEPVLVKVNAATTAAAPLFTTSLLRLPEGLAVTGQTSAASKVRLWSGSGAAQEIEVDESGRFNLLLPPGDLNGYNFTLVVVDEVTGGVAGRKVELAGGKEGMDAAGIVTAAMGLKASEQAARDLPLTRAAAAKALAGYLGWSEAGSPALTFKDAGDIPANCRLEVAEANRRGIFKGYPEGSFLPENYLTRAESAVVLTGVLRDLGLPRGEAIYLPYRDITEIPAWARPAVAETSSAGLLTGRGDGSFCPDCRITVAELARAMAGLVDYVKSRLLG
jgi:subtilisin family serine protease